MKFLRSAHSSMEGEQYEIRVAALLFLRCKTNAKVTQFQLATNAAAGGQKLDDVILRYKTVDRPDAWRTCFLQLKKRGKRSLTDTTLLGPSANFSLKSYVDSFLHIKRGMSADEREEILNGSFEDCLFVLYTNVQAEGKLLDRSTERGSLGQLGSLLLESEGIGTVLGFEEGRDADVFAALKGMGAEGFLEKMKVFSGQSTPDQLETVIKQELRLRGDVTEEYLDVLYKHYETRFTKWWKASDDLLDERSDIYDLALEEVRSHRVDVLSSQERTRMCFDVRFRDSATEGNTSAMLHVITSEMCLRSSVTKLLQTDRRFAPGSFAFFGLECLERELNTILPVWRSKGNPCWLVVVSTSSEDHRELGDKICAVLLENKDKRIAVVSRRSDTFASYLKRKLPGDYSEIEDACRVSQLDAETIGKLRAMSVSFQGVPVAGESFLSDNESLLEDIALDDCLIISLTSGKTHSIGQTLSKNESYYVSRTLAHPSILRPDVLLSDKLQGVVAVSGVTLKELRGMIPSREAARLGSEGSKYVLYDSYRTPEEWGKFCEGLGGSAAHWVHKHQGRLVLFESRGVQMDEMRSLVDPALWTTITVDQCFDVPQRYVLVTGEPGMGKTTFASHLARRTKEELPHLWVVHVNLPEHRDLLKRTLDPVKFLSAVMGVDQSPFHTSLLRRDVERTGRVAVLLDAFDEISPKYESQGLLLIAALLKTKVDRLWVTSRFFVQETIEREMSTLAMRLQDFTEENQTDFLARFWREKVTCIDRSDLELNDLIAKLLARVSESLNDVERRFIGIPLQTMMLAEVFSDYAAEPSKFPLPQKLDLNYLFEKFIENKFRIYVRKLLPATKTIVLNTILDGMRLSFSQKHMNASLVYLLNPHELEKLDSKGEIVRKTKEFTSRVLSGEEKTGIVVGVVDDCPTFLHDCFAEFFAARFFFEHYIQHRDFLRRYLYSVRLYVVREMFDELWARQRPLHLAVIYDDLDLAERYIREGSVVNETDAGGRSLLHLAAAYNTRGSLPFKDFIDVLSSYQNPEWEGDPRPVGPRRQHMVELLLENGADVNAVDYVLEWTPLEYAVGASCWDAAEILLATGSDPRQFVLPENDILRHRLWYSIAHEGHVELLKYILDQNLFAGDHEENHYVVHRSIVNGHIALVRLLVKNSKDVLTKRSRGRTLLHLAASCGQRQILDYLISVLKDEIGDIGCAAGVNLPDESGATAMHFAAGNGHFNIVQLLLACGGDSKFLKADYGRFLWIASHNGDLDIAKFVVECIGEDAELLRSCINYVDRNGLSCLMAAVRQDCTDMIRYLIEKGGDVTVVDDLGFSALHLSIAIVSLTHVKMIVESLGDNRDAVTTLVNASFVGGATPLHAVTSINFSISRTTRDMFDEQARIAEYIISRGANVWAVDESGNTPLQWAAKLHASLPVAKVMIKSLGNDVDAIISYINVTNLEGLTAKEILQDENEVHFASKDERAEFANWLDIVLKICLKLKFQMRTAGITMAAVD